VIVLDTHAWVWWATGAGDLSQGASEAIEAADRIGVCTISCWEVALLVARRRLQLTPGVERWVRRALADPRVIALGLDAATAVHAGGLDYGDFPGDPADRIIYATAVEHGVRLVTRDSAINAFDPPRVIW
jgi:PIN domain nuclease of toxin-antitoxin system